MEYQKEIREAIQSIGRACERAVESFDRMNGEEGGMVVALEAARDVSAIGERYQALHEILQAQAQASIARIMERLGAGAEPELETDGNVVTFPGRLN